MGNGAPEMRSDGVTAMAEPRADGGPIALISLGASDGFYFVRLTQSLIDDGRRWSVPEDLSAVEG